MFYSTPSIYATTIKKTNPPLPYKYDGSFCRILYGIIYLLSDFFPYGINPHGYLTGYYVSRATLKVLYCTYYISRFNRLHIGIRAIQ